MFARALSSLTPSSRPKITLLEAGFEDLPEEYRDLPPFFTEILVDVLRHKNVLGGLRNFPDYPRIDHKVKADEFRHGYTDFEYVYLTVLGFARLHCRGEEIVTKSNGKPHRHNPGVQLLEVTCGMTMHGDRDGAAALLRSAPTALLEAYRLSRGGRGGTTRFFKEAFDRTADPCLEGRLGRVLEYLEKARPVGRTDHPPWEDVSLQPLPPAAPVNDVVGEHLRVFINECTWQWARERSLEYEDAKTSRHSEEHSASFNSVFNADTFRAAMRARSVVKSEEAGVCWEVQTDSSWTPFDYNTNQLISAARSAGRAQVEVRLGPKGWTYEIDLRKFVQRNPKTGKERAIRCVKAAPKEEKGKGKGGKGAGKAEASAGMRQLSADELEVAIQYFVDMCTLPEGAPVRPSGVSREARLVGREAEVLT